MRLPRVCALMAGATVIIFAGCGGAPEVVPAAATTTATPASESATASPTVTANPTSAPGAAPTLAPSPGAQETPALAAPTLAPPGAAPTLPATETPSPIQSTAIPTPLPATITPTPPPPPTATATAAPSPTNPGIGQSPPDGDVNATFVLTPGGAPQTASGEVSYPLGDTVDRIVYVVEGAPETGGALTLQLTISCRFFGDRQFMVRVDGVSFTQACGTTIELPLEARVEAGQTTGLIIISAPGLGPTREEWTVTVTLLAPG